MPTRVSARRARLNREHLDRLALAAQRRRAERAQAEGSAGQPVGDLAGDHDVDVELLRELGLDARGRVDGIADRGEVRALWDPDRAEHDLTGVDANADARARDTGHLGGTGLHLDR